MWGETNTDSCFWLFYRQRKRSRGENGLLSHVQQLEVQLVRFVKPARSCRGIEGVVSARPCVISDKIAIRQKAKCQRAVKWAGRPSVRSRSTVDTGLGPHVRGARRLLSVVLRVCAAARGTRRQAILVRHIAGCYQAEIQTGQRMTKPMPMSVRKPPTWLQ